MFNFPFDTYGTRHYDPYGTPRHHYDPYGTPRHQHYAQKRQRAEQEARLRRQQQIHAEEKHRAQLLARAQHRAQEERRRLAQVNAAATVLGAAWRGALARKVRKQKVRAMCDGVLAVEELVNQVWQSKGPSEWKQPHLEHHHRVLVECLTQQLLKLDGLPVRGSTQARQMRKSVVNQVNSLIEQAEEALRLVADAAPTDGSISADGSSPNDATLESEMESEMESVADSMGTNMAHDEAIESEECTVDLPHSPCNEEEEEEAETTEMQALKLKLHATQMALLREMDTCKRLRQQLLQKKHSRKANARSLYHQKRTHRRNQALDFMDD